MGETILVVDKDQGFVNLLRTQLAELDYQVEHAADGATALKKALGGDYSLIIVERRIPGMEGIELCRRMHQKKRGTPIIVLAAASDELDRIVALESGVDDYLEKSISIRELVARIRALFRRVAIAAGRDGEEEPKHVMMLGDMSIDLDLRKVTRTGNEIDLTAKEFDLLVFLAKKPGRPYTREQILDNVWGYGTSGYDPVVTTYIARLRSKIEEDPDNPRYIQTVRGVGYKFMKLEQLKP
jgi:DNA-binding response OmpR family regulator